ncbi:MAG TPA: DUF1295 domain-containing protein [Pirellulales bacterium]
MTPLLTTLVITLAAAATLFVLLWIVSIKIHDVSIIDPFWGAGFVVVAWVSVAVSQAGSPRAWLTTILTTIWGLRLFVFLLVRKRKHKEDHRYAAMREKHGERFWWVSLFTVFLLQTAILWWVSLPVQSTIAADSGGPLNWLDAVGVLLWAVGLCFETVGDWQLARFKSDPQNGGRVMDRGLWRYTRHPNYFGDFCVWWGLYLIAASGGAAWTIGSPLVMAWLLMRVSGVTLLESTITERRLNYAEYQRRTSVFFPWPPASSK